MFAGGLIEETEALLAVGYDEKLRSMQTLAYKHVIRLIRGELKLPEAIALVQADTRHYAKRQLTWLKTNPPDEIYATPEAAYERLCSLLNP
ncbi:MAG: tRNA dimethylallyltransferase [Deltaproteobacteria bacterium ADurb.Bin510]|nr:MAG: tRNA dimethylallyltransferase [Deltaproteobacteria bacterium ADurb.Bin510]